MASSVSSPSSSTNFRHVRSISLPNRSLPASLQVEENIAHLKSWEASSSPAANVETLIESLTRLKNLYTSINDHICLPQTQQALLHTKDDTLIDELLDRSMSLLDVCGAIKDVVELVKEHIRSIQSALRRRKQEGLRSDSLSLKEVKDVKRTIVALKQIDNKIGSIALLDLDHHLSTLIRSLRDTTSLSVSIFGSLISFVSKPKSSKWAIVSSLIHKRKTTSLDQPCVLSEALDPHMEVIEGCLECMSRTLIKARVSLLNIRSH